MSHAIVIVTIRCGSAFTGDDTHGIELSCFFSSVWQETRGKMSTRRFFTCGCVADGVV